MKYPNFYKIFSALLRFCWHTLADLGAKHNCLGSQSPNDINTDQFFSISSTCVSELYTLTKSTPPKGNPGSTTHIVTIVTSILNDKFLLWQNDPHFTCRPVGNPIAHINPAHVLCGAGFNKFLPFLIIYAEHGSRQVNVKISVTLFFTLFQHLDHQLRKEMVQIKLN